MNKAILVILLAMLSFQCLSAENFCGDIQRTRVWASGSDMYGIWVEFKSNPSQCPGGFYIANDAPNKGLVYSTILAAKMAEQKICIQVFSHDFDLGNRCLLHYVYHP